MRSGTQSPETQIPSKHDEAGSIASVCKDRFAMGSYAVVVISCDTEEPPYDDFGRIGKSIADMYGQRICDKILFLSIRASCNRFCRTGRTSDSGPWKIGNTDPKQKNSAGEKTAANRGTTKTLS